MNISIPDKIKGFLFHPTETFREVRDEQPFACITYFIIITVIYAILASILTAIRIFSHPFLNFGIGPGEVPLELLPLAGFFVILVFTPIFAVVWGLWLHLFVYLMGGRKGVWETERTVFYNLTPTMLIGWIPVIGPVVGAIWSVIIGVIGIRELHQIPDTKAAIAVLLSVIIGGFIIVLTLGAFLVAAIASGPALV